jgi:hypothetical protein
MSVHLHGLSKSFNLYTLKHDLLYEQYKIVDGWAARRGGWTGAPSATSTSCWMDGPLAAGAGRVPLVLQVQVVANSTDI